MHYAHLLERENIFFFKIETTKKKESRLPNDVKIQL
jgi:hypothetical protein